MTREAQSIQHARKRIADACGAASMTAGEAEYVERHVARYVRTLALLPASPGSLLDVGCFPGHLSLLAADKGWTVTGLSRRDGSVIGASFEQRMNDRDIRLFDVDVERDAFPFADESFDAVLFNETVEHLPFNPYHALDQIWRVLKPGGVLVFSTPNFASFDHRWALGRGRTIYPLLTKSLGESFHADISQRHIREYTRDECIHLLSGQAKYLYSFEIQRVLMDRSWDGLFFAEHGYRASFRSIRIGTLLRAIVTRVVPSYRSNIVVVAGKPRSYVRVGARAVASEGFYPPEVSGTGPAFVRQPLEGCWSKQQARVVLTSGLPARRVERVDILAWLPAPASVGPLRISTRVNGVSANEIIVSPTPEPMRLSVRIPRSTPEGSGESVLRIELETKGWRPCEHGIESDSRTLGVMMCLNQVGLACEAPPC